MFIYYSIVTFISLAIVVMSYFFPQVIGVFGLKLNKLFGNTGMILLWVTLLVKPVFMILLKYSEIKTRSFSGLRVYLKTISGRSLKGLLTMVISIVYFIAARGMKLRRLLGITTFLAIFVHAGLWITQWIQSTFILVNQLQDFWIVAGYIGLAALFVGYVTSNDFSIRFFKGNWKTIQYTSYIALIFALLHIILLNPGEYIGHIVIAGIFIVLKCIEKRCIKIF